MPTIFILFGFRFMFYANDHDPIHVLKNNGLKSSEIKLVESVIEENQEIIAEYWNKFFNKAK